MKPLRPFVVTGGVACVLIGFAAALSNGTVQQVTELGRTLIIAGAILLAGAVIASAVAGQHK